ncbi:MULTISPECIES: glycosyltransferase family 4 protein [unclassified Rhizobium]|uniref:glycosyltransferase family 4 protein n=1 Tax=unclassified Rhizobium TaxID=2613769 RepID=UPI001AD98A52|nr:MULTISPECIES: glycosyltransferase family 4 protein [unclassified Rhizobium]MBO9125310.1 glycosyltransferase family 4 protein [Rhizobium sp. 16-488-2b]MBO9175895.1 glycosyltransferase family 4 protein [Rhizobium sp. 16-488-2a]
MVRARRILVHDYSGHPFQVQLARALARRGHEVLHVYSESFQTPKGDLAARRDDPSGFRIAGLSLSEPFQKSSFLKRRAQEIEFGRMVASEIRRFRPDIVLSANAPLDTQAVIHKSARACGARFVFWLQDIYSEAIARFLPAAFPLIGNAVARRYQRLEFGLLRESDHVVAITDDFVPYLRQNGITPGRLSVIENWAPLDEMRSVEPVVPESDKGDGLIRAVYAGTLGYKHNPDLLLQAAKALPVAIDVHSEGAIAENLARKAAAEGVSNLRGKPWVPFTDLPDVLGSADILVAMIEEGAGAFCVPSKVLTYFGCGRPVLASVPRNNLARRLIARADAGLASDPGDAAGFIGNLGRLAGDVALRRRLGANGLAYARANFAIEPITDRFEAIFAGLYQMEKQAI